MTIQRQYSLPNCKLVLEGLGTQEGVGAGKVRPLMTVLTSVECHFAGREQSLEGGRDFFEELVYGVSRYVQALMSGIPFRASHRDGLPRIQFQTIDANRHRLVVQSQPIGNGTSEEVEPVQIDLTTVQLFDLVEAVDQFFADAQTLPDLSLNLTPVPKKHAPSRQPLAQRTAPFALGLSSVALAAIALFFLPAPEIRRSEETRPGNNTADSLSPEAETTNQPDLGALESTLNAAPEITDLELLRTLQTVVYNQINQSWESGLDFEVDLAYRVGVNPAGEIVGYKPVDQAAIDNIQQTPLPGLLQPPAPAATETPEPLAQFRIVFEPSGRLRVGPWQGQAEPSE